MVALKKSLPVILFLIFLSSCFHAYSNYTDELGPLEPNEFYVRNFKTSNFYKVKASILASGDYCEIWVENGSAVTQYLANAFANKYDNDIRPRIINSFSEQDIQITDRGKLYEFDDILEFANWLAGKDNNKLTILLLDIQDDYHAITNPSYIAGYFYQADFFEKGWVYGTKYYSNGSDIIYIDISPGLKTENIEKTYATFAHELQHLINFATSVFLDREKKMDLWIDEGMSSQAEYIYLNENPKEKIDWFSKSDTIKKGNNFFVWDNHEDDMAIHDEYATVYLFFHWLYLQANTQLKSTIFKEIVNSSYYDYRAATNVAKKINSDWNDWGTLLRTWFAANYDPANTIFGYKGDSSLHSLKVYPIGGTDIDLFPGEGVYSIINESVNKTVTGNINYAGLEKNQEPSTVSPFNQDMLLTYNKSLNLNGGTETGSLTGEEPPKTFSSISKSQADGEKESSTGSYVLDARDVWGRDREKEIFDSFKRQIRK